MRYLLFAVSFAFSFLSLSSDLNAQVLYGSIVGTVTDASGAVVPNAQVRASNPQTGESRDAVTDENGRYTFANLTAGQYDIRVSAPSFKTYSQTGVNAVINSVVRVDVQLEVGASTQEITVQANAAMLQTEKSDVHTDLGSHEVTNLPLPAYRNYQSLYQSGAGCDAAAISELGDGHATTVAYHKRQRDEPQ